MHIHLILTIISTLAISSLAAFSPAYWGFTLEQNPPQYIQNAVTTMHVPSNPGPSTALFYLWPSEIGSTDNALVQTVLCAGPGCIDTCNAGPEQWCIFPGVYQSTAAFADGASIIANPGDLLDIEFNYDGGSGNVTQSVSRDGSQLTSYSFNVGAPWQYYIRFECIANEQITFPATTYSNTTIEFAQPVDISIVQSVDATTSPLEPSLANFLWYIDEIQFSESNCGPHNAGYLDRSIAQIFQVNV